MKNIIITGTSRGIGLALAKKLASEGHAVLALSRKSNEDLANITNINQVNLDLSVADDFKKVHHLIKSNWEKVDILIHNAGALVNKPFDQLTSNDFNKVYQVNVFAVAKLTQEVLPYLRNGSHVVTISSIGGIQGSLKFPGLAAYSSSKGAVITLSELLAEEYKNQGIAFNVLALGAVQTEMLEEAFPGYQAPISAKDMACYIADFALNGNKVYNGKVLQVSSSNP
jgi:NAD(P)-dependent dehydrogenase (short-subunit alcohol dehydrogenase family)